MHNLTRTRGRPCRLLRIAIPPAHPRGHGTVGGGRPARQTFLHNAPQGRKEV